MINIQFERWKQVLGEILVTKDFIEISDLSRIFNVSCRSIRYDLDNIDLFLRDNNLPQLVRKPNAGIKYPDNTDERRKIREFIGSDNKRYHILSKDQRINIILNEVLRQKDYITIDFLAEKLDVSRSTVIKDLIKVREWLEEYGLQFKASPRHGLVVDGDENQLRKAAVGLLVETMDLQGTLNDEQASLYEKYCIPMDRQIKILFNDIDMPYIENCIEMLEQELGTTFSDEAYSNLAIHMAIAIKRIQLGRKIVMPAAELKSLEDTKEYMIASQITQRLEEHFNLQIPVDETGYITIHLLGSSISNARVNEGEDWLNLQILTDQVIKDVSDRVHIDLTKDKQLYDGLKEHLRPAIYRLKHGLKTRNPILKEIKSGYSELFQIVKECMAVVEKYAGRTFNDDEIGYFTIHFGASIERLKPVNILRPHVLVVCGTGLGTAKLLSTRLQGVFDVDIIDTIAHHQVKNILKDKNVDLVVTTLPYRYEGVETIRVNALLNDSDIDLLRNSIKYTRVTDKNVNNLVDIIKSSCNIQNYEKLIADLSEFLNFTNKKTCEGAVQPMLREIISEDIIKLNVDAGNWEDAVRAGGELLESGGYVKPSYIDAMIDAVKEMGPYIVVAPGIAMPHARPESGAMKIGMSLITLKNPVNFGNKENDPVNIVISLCAIDHSTHIKALSELVTLLKDPEFISTLLNSKDNREIIRYINNTGKSGESV